MLKSGSPRHVQVSAWLRQQIESGTYKQDDQLPSESQLGARFGVSRITVRRALQTLESEGLIYRKQGLGSFVSAGRMRHGLVHLTDFVEDMTRAGLEASSLLTHFEPESATPDIANLLKLAEATTVFRVDRLRLGDGKPIAFDQTWLPIFYAQLLQGHDLEKETIYSILERKYNIPVVRGFYRIQAVNASLDIAQKLDVSEGQALLLIERSTTSHGEKHLYYQRRYYRSDRVYFELQLHRPLDHPLGLQEGMPLEEFEPVFRKIDYDA